LCAGDYKAINWRMVAWSYGAWFVTLPATAVISGVIMAFCINAPSFAAPLN
jgi:sodium-dependent phosphate transporter